MADSPHKIETKTSQSEESVSDDPGSPAEEVLDETYETPGAAAVGAGAGTGGNNATEAETASTAKSKKPKKKKKKSEGAGSSSAVAGGSGSAGEEGEASSAAMAKLTDRALAELLKNNPALKSELQDKDPETLREMLKKLTVSDVLTGAALGGKNQKDMASHKFWQTQPVPSFRESGPVEEGPIKTFDAAQIPRDPPPFAVEGFNWVTLDLEDEKELEEVYELLSNHYVEDDDAKFRFNYSPSFLNWALKAPGWKKDWHVGVRATQSGRLVAFISGIPMELRIRQNSVKCSEINFLCIHKKLRSKRLAPILIKEIARRCNVEGIFQAIYTAGIILPKPVATCRYFHRSLNWEKLYDVSFSPLPTGSTKSRQVSKYKLPKQTTTPGLRPIKIGDVDQVVDLLGRYLDRVELAQKYSREEAEHWLVPKTESDADADADADAAAPATGSTSTSGNDEASKTATPLKSPKKPTEKVVWTYVVEEEGSGKITDFFSFYSLNSTVIGNSKHSQVKAAYLFYYASEAAFHEDKSKLKVRLNQVMNDALIVAKNDGFDVFNALTLLDNPLFLQDQKFGAGDGQLHYYLFNYRTAPIPGGVGPSNDVDPRYMGGVGVVML